MADLTPTRTFYEAQSRDALGLAFVAQLRATIAAYKASEFVDLTLSHSDSDLVEKCRFDAIDQRVELYRLGQCIGIDLRELERAIS